LTKLIFKNGELIKERFVSVVTVGTECGVEQIKRIADINMNATIGGLGIPQEKKI